MTTDFTAHVQTFTADVTPDPDGGEDAGRALEGVHEGHALQHPLI